MSTQSSPAPTSPAPAAKPAAIAPNPTPPAPTSPAPAAKPAAIAPNPTPPAPTPPKPTPPPPLRNDGPTLKEYVAAGYKAETYPPTGYAPRSNFVYFRKELLTSVFVVQGKPVAFEPLDGNRGVLKLDPEMAMHAPLIAGLNEAAQKQRGGIVKISEGEYSDIKSLHPYNPQGTSATRSQDEKLKIAPRAGMEGKAFRPPPPKGVSQSKPNSATPADTKPAPAADVIDGVLQAPNPVPDFVPRMGKVGAAAAKDPPE